MCELNRSMDQDSPFDKVLMGWLLSAKSPQAAKAVHDIIKPSLANTASPDEAMKVLEAYRPLVEDVLNSPDPLPRSSPDPLPPPGPDPLRLPSPQQVQRIIEASPPGDPEMPRSASSEACEYVAGAAREYVKATLRKVVECNRRRRNVSLTGEDDVWVKGIISTVNINGTFDIKYSSEGTEEREVNLARLRSADGKLDEGCMVSVHRKHVIGLQDLLAYLQHQTPRSLLKRDRSLPRYHPEVQVLAQMRLTKKQK